MMNSWVIGVDVGGTFTDFSARELNSGRQAIHKRPSTPDDPSRAILDGLSELKEKFNIEGIEIARFGHGTTVATNALLQRRGAAVGVVTTKGFRDLLEIGRQVRPSIYDLQADAPPPLAERKNRIEVLERIGSEGEVITELTDMEVGELVNKVKSLQGVESIAICLLFSFLNPDHEQKLVAALRSACPNLVVSVSSEVQPEFREYERFSTTLINAFLQPEVSSYMDRLKRKIAVDAPNAILGIFQSSGGLMSVERASEFPVRTALSGPAAGVVGAAATAQLSNIDDIITLDIGGTSTDVCLIQNGKIALSTLRDIAGFRIRLPMVDIHTVGAGGGSIAHVGNDGLLKVGPQSAGAVPGPACYGLGGTKPTVSDASMFLGRLPTSLAGGGMAIDRERAEMSLEDISAALNISKEKMALGIIGIVNSNMVRAIRAVSVEKGHDPRNFTLMAFGGAGGLHAAEVARSLGMKKIIVPHSPGILCAEGLIVSDLQENFVGTCRTRLSDDLALVANTISKLLKAAGIWFEQEASVAVERRQILSLDMRYVGQNYELPIEVANGSDVPSLPDTDVLKTWFFEEHNRSYGHFDPDASVEIINLRLRAIATLAQGIGYGKRRPSGPIAPTAHQSVWFSDAGPVRTPLYDRDTLPEGTAINGPAIITQLDTTTIVPPRATICVDHAMNMIMEIGPDG